MANLPKFEAGTPNISGAIGLAAAIDYLENIGWIIKIMKKNCLFISMKIIKNKRTRNLWTGRTAHSGVISFNLEGIHPHDLATALDLEELLFEQVTIVDNY